MHKTCTKWAFYHIKYFYLPQSTDEETKWNEMKSEERKRTIVMLTQQFLCFVGYRTCHQANWYSKMQRKKEDSKRQRHTQQFLRMLNFCLNLVIDLPELSESYECAMNACMLRCNVAFFFSRLFARRMLKIQSHLTFIDCIFGQMLHRGLDTISRARLPSSLHTHLIYVYHRYFYYYYLTALIWSPLATYWMVAHTQHSNILLNNGSI